MVMCANYLVIYTNTTGKFSLKILFFPVGDMVKEVHKPRNPKSQSRSLVLNFFVLMALYSVPREIEGYLLLKVAALRDIPGHAQA